MSPSWWLLLGIVVGSLFVMNLGVHILYALVCLRRFEMKPPFQILPPPKDAPAAEPFQVTTADGLTLQGSLYFPDDGQPQGMVLFFSEADAPKESSMNYAQALVEAGFAVIAFDFRNHGASEELVGYTPNHWMTDYELLDAQAVLKFVEDQPQLAKLPLGFMGLSRGANVALALAASASQVSHIWTQGAFSTGELAFYHARRSLRLILGWWFYLVPDWHVRVTIWFIKHFSQFRNGTHFVRLESTLPLLKDRTVLFASGKRDSYVPSTVVEKMCTLSGHGPEVCWEVAKAKHNQERHVAPDIFDQRLVQFFNGMRQTPITGLTSEEFEEPVSKPLM